MTSLCLHKFYSDSIANATTAVIRRSISPTNINIFPKLLDLLYSVLKGIGIQTRDLTSMAGRR